MQAGNASYVPFQGNDRGDLQAFIGIPKRTLIEPGELLCRFITAENKTVNHRGNEVFDSPWWHSMTSFMQIYNLAKSVKSSLDNAARARLAITDGFNPTMEYFCQIHITRPIYGWVGTTRWQEDGKRNICYLGGAEQTYLPNLVPRRSSGMSSEYAFIRYFGRTDSLGE